MVISQTNITLLIQIDDDDDDKDVKENDIHDTCPCFDSPVPHPW